MDYHPDDTRTLVMSLMRCYQGSRSFYKVQGLDQTVDSCSQSLMNCATSYFHVVDTLCTKRTFACEQTVEEYVISILYLL